MIVSELLDSIKLESDYVINSLILKSSDDKGLIYKWLIKSSDGMAYRKELFIATEGIGDIENRTILLNIEIANAK